MYIGAVGGTSCSAAKSARGAARQLKMEIVERQVASVEELRLDVKALKAQEADAYFYINDAMVTSHAQSTLTQRGPKKVTDDVPRAQPRFVRNPG
jgi:ABC-type uncharacterized transport system substrate-binding protein